MHEPKFEVPAASSFGARTISMKALIPTLIDLRKIYA
jgi:hypothetical protein